MGRTSDTNELNKLIDRYQESIDEIIEHIRVCLFIEQDSKKIEQINENSGAGLTLMSAKNAHHIYESSLVSAVVVWQSFASDWILTAIACDPSEINRKLLDAGPGTFKVGGVSIYSRPERPRKSMSVDRVRELIDRDNRNLSVNDVKSLNKYSKLLVPELSEKVSAFSEVDDVLMQLCTAMRDYAAHKSTNSLERLNDQLSISGPLLGQSDAIKLTRAQQRTKNLGLFLYSHMVNAFPVQNTRLGYLLWRLRELPEKLR